MYRTPATLERQGLVSRIETNGDLARFEVEHNRHHHFICDQCGAVTDFTWAEFDNLHPPEIVPLIGARIKNH